MPQLDLFGLAVPNRIVWDYGIDPLHPLKAGALQITVTGARDRLFDCKRFRIPNNVVHEMVDDILTSSWQGYLFGDPHDAVMYASEANARWLTYSAMLLP